MRTSLRLCAAFAFAAVAVGACGGDDESAVTTSSFQIGSPATVEPSASTVSPQTAATIGPVTAETTDIPFTTPVGTGDIPVVAPVDSTDTPVIIAVFVGTETGPDRIEAVPLGSTVSIAIVNDAAADEYHVHGYDLGDGQGFAAGETAMFTFTADTAGDFEVESHVTESVLFILRVA